MLKFSQFVNEELGEDANLGNVARQEAQPAPAPAPAPAQPVIKSNLNDRIVKLTTKYKSGVTTTGTTVSNTGTTQADPLTWKIQKYRAGQVIDIKLKPNIIIKAQVAAAGKKKYCKLLKSNIEEISLLLKQPSQQPAGDTGIVDKAGNPMKAQPTQQKPIYFQTFKDKDKKDLTWFYFYDNTEFTTNPKAAAVFSKTYVILEIE